MSTAQPYPVVTLFPKITGEGGGAVCSMVSESRSTVIVLLMSSPPK